MSTTPTAREARRRRIMERGSDRLALITGRIQNVEQSPLPARSRSFHAHRASCPPSMFFHDFDHDESEVPYEIEDRATSFLSPKVSANNSGSRGPSLLRKCETFRSPLEIDSLVEPSRISSNVQTSQVSTSDSAHHVESVVQLGEFFTPNQVCSAIAVTKSTRIYCSLITAILVVLSCIGFPILGSHIIRSILFFRPLYLVLLTNISIVIAQLLLGKHRGSQEIKREADNTSSVAEEGFVEQIGKTLEMGFLLQKIMDAIFMDSIVYAVVTISGLSLVQKLGW
ncbi:hypothetical protein NMG60_11027940 [Bertholletia excelsa]